VFVDGVTVILVELHEAVGVSELGDDFFEEACFVHLSEGDGEGAGAAEDGHEGTSGLGGEGFIGEGDLFADEFLELGGEADLIEGGEFEDLEDVFEAGGVAFADGGGGIEFLLTDLEDAVGAVGHDGFEADGGDGFFALEFGEAAGDAGDGGGVAEVLLHELFDGDLGGGSPVAPFGGESHLFGAGEDFLRAAGGEVEIEADAIEEFVTVDERFEVFGADSFGGGEVVKIADAEFGVTDPADEVEVAETAGRVFDVGFELLCGPAVGLEFGEAGVGAEIDEGAEASADEFAFVTFFEFAREDGVPPEMSGFDERGGEFDVLSGHLSGVAEGADAVSEFETGVPDIADDIGGERGVLGGRGGVVEEEEIEVGEGSDFATTATTDGDDGGLGLDLGGGCGGELGESLGDELENELVGLIGEGADEVAGGFTSIETVFDVGTHRGDFSAERGKAFESCLVGEAGGHSKRIFSVEEKCSEDARSQMASFPISPVRMRTTSSRVKTVIFPSPI